MISTILDKLKKYSHDAQGSKWACKKHQWACLRFLRDIESQGTDSFPYVFSESRADRFFEWMQLFKHTKGVLAGQKKVPAPIEEFFFGNIYGWVHRDTGFRRFRQAYWQVARKNAKSQDLAILGTYELAALGEPCSEVIVAATKKEQTKYVWEEADLIIRQCDLLRDKFRTRYGIINHLRSSSKFMRLSEDDRKRGDGGNPQCGILDEYHAHVTSEYYDLLTSGMKTRNQPLLIIITTAGFDLSHPCYRDEYKYVSRILDPDNPIENDRYFAMVNELDRNDSLDAITLDDGVVIQAGEMIDDVSDESCWVKANPILAMSETGVNAIRAELALAMDKPEKRRDFLTKTMNIWVQMRECGYMDSTKWSACQGVLPWGDGCGCYVGLDLSAKIDLTSVAIEWCVDDTYYVFSHSFIPESRVIEKIREDNVPYDLWIAQGHITAIQGDAIDYRVVKEWAIGKVADLGLRVVEWCVDPWGATQLSSDLIDDGHTVVDIVQGIRTLSEPTKDFRCMVYSRRIVHDGNPVLAWAMGNAVVDIGDRNENIQLSKKKSKQRIDPAAALINAHVRAMVSGSCGIGVGVMLV